MDYELKIKEKEPISFSELKAKDFFLYNDELYMRLNEDAAVNFDQGMTWYFGGDTQVKLVEQINTLLLE
jgi:hypothetical protein